MLYNHTSFVTFALAALFSLSSHSPTPSNTSIPLPLFADLEFLSRAVDIAYCVGTSGIYHPFKCLSRCDQFPSFELVDTFNTGPLMSDSCGYIAVSHGSESEEENIDETGTEMEKEGGRIIVAFRGTYSFANTIADLSSMPQEYIPYPGDGQQQQPPERKKGWMGRWWDYLRHGGTKMRVLQQEMFDLSRSQDLQPPHQNSSTMRKECNNCTVHTGFWTSWQNTRRSIMPQLQKLRESYPDYRLDLVGHSLGGAVAALAGLEIEALGWHPIVTTFGEPRIGNLGLRDYVDDVFDLLAEKERDLGERGRRYRRVTHVEDPVPLLPLAEWGYRPHAGEIYISKKELQPELNDVRFCIGNEDPECIAGAEASDAERVRGSKSGSKPKSLQTEAAALVEEARIMVAQGKILRADAKRIYIAGEDVDEVGLSRNLWSFPARYKMWQLLFAHRDYFWRLGLCVPGGDPMDWGRGGYEEGEKEL